MGVGTRFRNTAAKIAFFSSLLGILLQKYNQFNIFFFYSFSSPISSILVLPVRKIISFLVYLQSVRFRSSRSEVFCKKVFLEILQNSHENTYTRVSFLIKLQAYLFLLDKQCHKKIKLDIFPPSTIRTFPQFHTQDQDVCLFCCFVFQAQFILQGQ